MKLSNPTMPTKDHSSASDPSYIGRTFSTHRNSKAPSHVRIDSGHYMVSRLSSDEESESDEEVVAMSPVRDYMPAVIAAAASTSRPPASVSSGSPRVPPVVSALRQSSQHPSTSGQSQLYALLTNTQPPVTIPSDSVSALAVPPGAASRVHSISPAASFSILAAASALRRLPSCFNFAIAEQQPRASYKFSTPEETLTQLFQCLTLAYRYTFT